MDNFILRPGVNTVDIRGNLNTSAILGLAYSDKYSESGIIPFQLLGNTVTNHGSPLPYFADSLASANTTVNIDVGEIIRKALGGSSS
jgi:hypothetical protein